MPVGHRRVDFFNKYSFFLHKKAINSKCQKTWVAYRRLRNCITNRINQAKSEFIQTQINNNSGKSGAMWSVLKSICKNNKSNKICLEVNQNIVSDADEVAECLNNYFVESVEKLAKESDSDYDQIVNGTDNPEFSNETIYENNIFEMPVITTEFVKSEIDKLGVKKGTGYDHLSARLLKYVCKIPLLIQTLVYILNLSLETCIFPDAWKIGRVQPIYKSGDKSSPNNYRPITILPVISKVIEKAIHSELMSFLTRNSILCPNQFGFRPNHSCETALLCMIDEWSRNVDDKEMNGLIFLDLRRAFDTVNHQLLLRKLSKYGCSVGSLSWFDSYLSHRKQYVSVENNKSTIKDINIGLPQGSILGPLLFVLFINDLPQSIPNGSVFMYADDTTISVSGSTKFEIETQLNDVMKLTYEWLIRNKLILNIDKTKVMLLGSRQRINLMPDKDLHVNVNDRPIACVNEYKCLGVIIDSYLDFRSHTYKVAKEVKQKLGILRRLKTSFSVQQLSQIYWGYVMPHMLYCCNVWTGRSDVNYDILNRLHKRAAYLISKLTYETPSNVIFNQLSWPTLDTLFWKTACCTMFKLVHNLAPPILSSRIVLRDSVITRNSRRSNKMILKLPKCRTVYYQNSFLYSGGSRWNNLPDNVRLESRLSSFKLLLESVT